MFELWLGCAFQFGNDPLGKSLAEFNAPLVEESICQIVPWVKTRCS